MLGLVVLLANMSVDNEEHVSDLFLVHDLDSLLRMIWVLEAHIAIVFGLSLIIYLHMC